MYPPEGAVYLVVVQSLGFLTLVALAAAVVLGASALLPGERFPDRLVAEFPVGGLRVAFVAALSAMLGSLYLSEIVGFEPCELCWFQRIAMYPLVIVLGVALLRRDLDVWKTALPIAGIGAAISIYHVMIQWRPALELKECTGAVPCSARYVMVWGFVSIPVMAGGVFLLIVAIMTAIARRDPMEAVEGPTPE
jgi:disulfide bond formation protein DsbB